MSEEHIDIVSEPEETEAANEAASAEEQLRIELNLAKDRTLRAMADLENYRARSARQAAEERKYANLDLIRELLPVWDNIGRALEAAEKNHSLETLVEGVKLVDRQLLDLLQKFHCEKIEALHQPFDPNVHASIAQMPNGEFPPNTVIAEPQIGFKLYDRVVRPSQVVLSAAPAV
ncbi:MAG: nucleotide exchange factor GrpE [Planctomycetaceae bacterium]|jgi:molecular chaperone GrpE|nr:nucleotide exchange factor GrpE [Planctomycetaceae bacterium]